MSEKQDLLVPIEYMDKQRMFYLLNTKLTDADSPKIESVYPRMAYSISDISYDPSRQLNPTYIMSHNYYDGNKDITEVEVNRVPYNISFNLHLVSIHRSDLFQMMEQILPWFTPSLSVRANINPYIGDDNISVPILLSATNFEDFNNEAPFSDQPDKPITMTLSFVMKTFLYVLNDEDIDGSYPGNSIGKTIKEIEAGVTFTDDKRPVTDDSLYTIHIPEHIG